MPCGKLEGTATARDELLGGAGICVDVSSAASGLQPWSSEPLMMDAQSRLISEIVGSARTPLVKAISRDPNDWLAWWLLSVPARARTNAGWLRSRCTSSRCGASRELP